MTDRFTKKKKNAKSKKELWSQIEDNFKDEQLFKTKPYNYRCWFCKKRIF